MITMYDNYIYYIMNKHYSGYSSRDDLFQVGRIGLLKAYQNYDASYGTQFKSYAYDYIKGEMYQFIQQDRSAKFSRSVTQLKNSIERATILLTQELMRRPTVSELAKYLDEPETSIIEAMQTIYQMQSLQMPITQDEKELTIEDAIASPQVDIDQLIAFKDALENLSPFEKELFMRRYYGETQTEIAEEMGINQVQVSRKVKKIGEKIIQTAA